MTGPTEQRQREAVPAEKAPHQLSLDSHLARKRGPLSTTLPFCKRGNSAKWNHVHLKQGTETRKEAEIAGQGIMREVAVAYVNGGRVSSIVSRYVAHVVEKER